MDLMWRAVKMRRRFPVGVQDRLTTAPSPF